jgi:hypothetical protein
MHFFYCKGMPTVVSGLECMDYSPFWIPLKNTGCMSYSCMFISVTFFHRSLLLDPFHGACKSTLSVFHKFRLNAVYVVQLISSLTVILWLYATSCISPWFIHCNNVSWIVQKHLSCIYFPCSPANSPAKEITMRNIERLALTWVYKIIISVAIFSRIILHSIK